MPYIRTNWVNNKTKLNADNMNNIEDGINQTTSSINKIDTKIDNINDKINILENKKDIEVIEDEDNGTITFIY